MNRTIIAAIRSSACSLLFLGVIIVTAVYTAAQTHGNVTASAANLRQGPDTSSTVLAKIPRGESAKLVRAEAFGDWYYVEYNGKTGWLHKSTIDLVTITQASSSPGADTKFPAETLAAEREKYVWRGEQRLSNGNVLRFGSRRQQGNSMEWVMEVRASNGDTLIGWTDMNCSEPSLFVTAGVDYDRAGSLISYQRELRTRISSSKILDHALETICEKKPDPPIPGPANTPGISLAKTLDEEERKYDWRSPEKIEGLGEVRLGLRKRSGATQPDWVIEITKVVVVGFFGGFGTVQLLQLQAECSTRNFSATSFGFYGARKTLLKDGKVAPGKLSDFLHRSVCVGSRLRTTVR